MNTCYLLILSYTLSLAAIDIPTDAFNTLPFNSILSLA